MSEKNITQQAIDKLKQALFDKGSYLHLIASRDKVILKEDNEYVTQVAQLLKKIESTEKDYANIRAQQNRASYIRNTFLSSPEYEEYQEQKQELELSITNLQQKYIDSTQQQTAQQISEKLLPDVITPTLITDQIKHMEKMFSIYYSGGTDQYYFNIPIHKITEPDGKDAHEQEKKLITKYQILLQESVKKDINNIFKSMLPKAEDEDEKPQKNFDTLINSFFNNQNIKNLLINYANLYAKRIFCEINQKLYSDFGAVNLETTNIKFFQTELNNAIAEQNLFLTKINLLCQQTIQDKYIIKHDTGDNKYLEQIIQDIEQLTPKDINDFIKTATDRFYKIPNYQLLSPKQQEQFINKFIFIEYQTFLNQKKGIEKGLITQKINSLIAETNKQIELAQIDASKTQQPLTLKPQSDLLKEITGWSTEPVVSAVNLALKQEEDATYSLYSNTTEIYYKIAGVDRLTPEQKNIFIKQIDATIDKLTKQAENHNWATWVLNKSYNGIKSLFYSLPELPPPLQNDIQAIQTAIHTTFATQEKIAKKIENFKAIYKTDEIKDLKIRTKLEQDLTDDLINFKKNKFNISPIPPFTEEESKKDPAAALKTRLDNIINRIETAKILTNIKSFEDIPLDKQLIYIDKINKHLMQISILNNKKPILQDELSRREDAELEIIENKKAIEKEQQDIKEIIININLYSKQFTNIRTDFSITEEDSTGIMQKLKDLLSTETAQNVISGAGIAVICTAAASTLGGFASNIPVIGSFITPVANVLSSFNVIAAGLIGGIIGTKVPFRKILKPITYVFEEISDIWKNPNNNSYLDRTIRAAAILAPIAAAAVVAGFILAPIANPFTGPVIAGIVAGAVATFALSSVCGWIASKVCKTIREYNLYDAKYAQQFCNNDPDKAQQLSIFFKNHIAEYNDKLNNFKSNSLSADLEKVHIQKILSMLQRAWKNITENKDPEWDNLLKVLYYAKKGGYQKQLEAQVKIADDVTDQLIKLVDTPKCVKSRELEAKLESINKNQRAAISFKDTTVAQLNAFIDTPNKELENLYKISSIIKNRNSK